MENMKVPELKALAKERRLRRYSKLRKAELIALLAPPALVPRTRPPKPTRPPPPPPTGGPPTPPPKPDSVRQIKRRKIKITN